MTPAGGEAIFHLAEPGAWDAALAAGEVSPPSLAAEGFVHCSTQDQLVGTIERHFAGVDALVVVQLDPASLADALHWEESRPGEVYPHVHRALLADDVVAVLPWHREPDGSVRLPRPLR